MLPTITPSALAASISNSDIARVLDDLHTRKLYQYRPPTAWALENLCRSVIYFRSPRDFNDPYDCRTPPVLRDLTDGRFARLRLRRDLGLLKIPGSNAMPKDELVGKINEKLGNMHTKLSQKCGVACFSKSNDNLLMWSHYADGGKGFCLNFHIDIRKHLGDDVEYANVKYRGKFPTAYGLVVLLAKNRSALYGSLFSKFLLTHKYKEWEYEQEARMIRGEIGEKHYPPETLKTIYLGTEATEGTKTLVRIIRKEVYPHAELLYGHPSNDEHRVDFSARPRRE